MPNLDEAFRRASDIEPRSARWFWRRRLAAAQLNVLGGVQGTGKSMIALDIAAEATRRGEFVLVLSAEDDDEMTVVPRLIAAGADLDRVLVLRHDFELWLPNDFDHLRELVDKAAASMVILDPIIAFVDGETNSWRDHDVRRVLRELRAVARETGATLLGVMHPKKGEEAEVVNVISGAVAWTAAPRSTIVLTKARGADGEALPDDDPRRVLFHVKCNVGAMQPPLTLEVVSAEVAGADGAVQTARVEWGEEDRDLRAAEHIGRAKVRPNSPQRSAAEDWLLRRLRGGLTPAKDVMREWKEAEGGSAASLRRAKEALGVESVKAGTGWDWRLPPEPAAF